MPTRKKADPAPAVASSTAPDAPATTPAGSAQQEAYCVKCKTKRVMKDPHETTTNGRRMMKGTCPECGTNMNRIMGKA
jgi:Zn finger protein HypA/HybF involved in hydrogenase expression